MKRLLSFLLVLILIFFVVGCHPFLDKGWVVNKEHLPAHYYTRWVTISHQYCSGSGSKRTCDTTYTDVPETDWEPDEWFIDLSSCDPDGAKKDCDTSRVFVTEAQYNQAQLHHYIDLS